MAYAGDLRPIPELMPVQIGVIGPSVFKGIDYPSPLLRNNIQMIWRIGQDRLY